MRLWIEAPGEVDAFTGKPTNYHLATVKSVESGRLVLTAPLKFAVPAKTSIRDADGPNLIELRGACEDILIRNLQLFSSIGMTALPAERSASAAPQRLPVR